MSGGLISDLQTAMIAMVGLAIIVYGVDRIKEAFEASIRDRYIESARKHRAIADNEYVDQTLRDVHRARYRAAIRRAV